MNLNNKAFQKFTPKAKSSAGNDYHRDIPHFQTIQSGVPWKCPAQMPVGNGATESTSSSSNISAQTLLLGACRFPAAHRSRSMDKLLTNPLTTSSSEKNDRFVTPDVLLNRNKNFRVTNDHSLNNQAPENGNKSRSSSTASSNFFGTTPSKNVKTPKSVSTTTSGDSSNSLTEGRGNSRGEVGLAASDSKRPHLILCQISDTQTYTNILRKINILNPIVIPNTFYDNMNSGTFYNTLADNFPRVRITTVQRKFFKDVDGYNQIKELCLEEYSSVLPIIQRKYFTLAAAAACLKFIEFQRNIVFSPNSLRIDYQGSDNTLFIDFQTAERLELVVTQSMDTCSSNTLFKVLNKCSTLSGQKRLRSLILQPSIDIQEINSRLDCVQELVENHEQINLFKGILPKFWDVEQLFALNGQISNYKESDVAAEVMINYALMLKTTLESIPPLKQLLSHMKSTFYQKFALMLENKQFMAILERIYKVLNEDAHLSPRFDVNLFQRCFSIKTCVNSFLDIARIAYVELVHDFNEIVEDLIKKYHLPLTIKTLKSKGFVLHMKIDEKFRVNSLPAVFIQVQKSKSAITMTTKELLFLKERIRHFTQEIQLLSSSIIFDMLQEIREHVGVLYGLCENIAELDVIVSFADTSRQIHFIRPSFSENTMVVKESLHPILIHVSKNKPVSNNIIASLDDNVSIITGANMAGKSIYIRQVALVQIMSQMGCYVPAEYAEFRITDRIFSRIGFHDNIECNASTFVVEVSEMLYIMQSLTPRSLIIIDELCRGTSTEEGTALAWAFCEELLASAAFIFCTTHFLFLTKLQDVYPNVSNFHLEAVELKCNDVPTGLLTYTHRLVPGVIKLEHYGLMLARSTAISEEVLRISELMCAKLARTWKVTSVSNETVTVDRQIHNIFQKLHEILDNGMLTVDVLEFLERDDAWFSNNNCARFINHQFKESNENIDGENDREVVIDTDLREIGEGDATECLTTPKTNITITNIPDVYYSDFCTKKVRFENFDPVVDRRSYFSH